MVWFEANRSVAGEIASWACAAWLIVNMAREATMESRKGVGPQGFNSVALS